MKGMLIWKGDPKKFAFQDVQMQFEGRPHTPWKLGEPRVNKLIFIDRDLNRKELTEGVRKCFEQGGKLNPSRSVFP